MIWKKGALQKGLHQKFHIHLLSFFLVLFMSILTWGIQPGQFEYESVEIEGVTRNLVVPSSFHRVDKTEANPAGLRGILLILGVPIHKWWNFFIPLYGILFVIQMILLSVALIIGI